MSNLKKSISPWISIIFHFTKFVLNKIDTKRGKWEQVFLYSKKSIDGYYQKEGKMFVWLQILIILGFLIYSIVSFDFSQFIFVLTLFSLITLTRTIEYLKPDWISNI